MTQRVELIFVDDIGDGIWLAGLGHHVGGNAPQSFGLGRVCRCVDEVDHVHDVALAG